MTGNRADIDDIAFTFLQVGKGSPCYQKYAADISGIYIFVIFKGCSLEWLTVYQIAGVVYKNIDTACFLSKSLNHFVDLFFMADIGAE
ncbi:hypothetical protein ES703_124810 [subsurface metagenome]